MIRKMKFLVNASRAHAYIAREGNDYGITIWGADYHHLMRVLDQSAGDDPLLRNIVLSDYYDQSAIRFCDAADSEIRERIAAEHAQTIAARDAATVNVPNRR